MTKKRVAKKAPVKKAPAKKAPAKKAPAKKAAAKKAAAKKNVPAVTSKKNVLALNPSELLKQQLESANKRIAQKDGKRVKLSITGFTAPDNSVGKELNVVIVDYTNIHAYYDEAYDPDNLVPPVCYANNRIHSELAPHEDSPDPQGITCASCEMNRFGSAPNGKAKACRNSRLLAVLPLDAISSAPMWTFSVSPTSIGNFDTYVRELMAEGATPMFVATTIGFEVVKTYAKVTFEYLDLLDEDQVAAVMSRLPEAQEILDMTPDWESDKAA